MKKSLISLAVICSLSSVSAIAADKTPEPSYSISGNLSAATDYRFRGVSQTDKKPAVQGGLDLVFKNGLSVGTWTSNVSQWANYGGSQEIDLYGGYSTEVAGVGVSVGGVSYWYPRNKWSSEGSPSNNTFEYYLGLAYGPISYKLSKTNGNWFGVEASSATYHDLSYSLGSLGLSEKFGFALHIGKQSIAEEGGQTGNDLGFKDYSVKASYNFSDDLSASLVASKVKFGTKADAESWFVSASGKKLGGSSLVASITKTF
jgi:uncharacterized protein (TIGR02001 family)